MGKRYQVTEQISNINTAKWRSKRTPSLARMRWPLHVTRPGEPKNHSQLPPPQRSLPQLLKPAQYAPLEATFPDLMHTRIVVQHSKGTRSIAQGLGCQSLVPWAHVWYTQPQGKQTHKIPQPIMVK